MYIVLYMYVHTLCTCAIGMWYCPLWVLMELCYSWSYHLLSHIHSWPSTVPPPIAVGVHDPWHYFWYTYSVVSMNVYVNTQTLRKKENTTQHQHLRQFFQRKSCTLLYVYEKIHMQVRCLVIFHVSNYIYLWISGGIFLVHVYKCILGRLQKRAYVALVVV